MNGSNPGDQVLPQVGEGRLNYSDLKEAQHKIRNFIHVNDGIVSILLASDNITGKQKELLNILKENSASLQDAVDDIFDLTNAV